MKMTTTIEQSTVDEINRLHEEFQSLATDAADRAIRIGALLYDMKRSLEHGNWLPWLHTHVAFSERTAQNYMRIFQNQARLKSENVADLTRASLELDKPSAKLEEHNSDGSAHSGFLENVRNDLETPQSPGIEGLKRVYRARLLSAEKFRLRERGIHCWTLTEVQGDPGLFRAFEMVYAAYGFDGTIRFLSGLNGFDRDDVIHLASLDLQTMCDLRFMVTSKYWPAKFSIDFLDEAPTKSTTFDEMEDRCLASKELRIAATIDGFVHILEMTPDSLSRLWFEAASYPGGLSKIPTRFSTMDELQSACMATKEMCLYGYIGMFNYRCEVMREGLKTQQSAFPASYETKLQTYNWA